MLKRIAVEDLRAGMYLQELCASWMEHPFWRSSFLLKDPRDLERIRAAGVREVWIDTARGLDVEAGHRGVATREQVEANVEQVLTAAAVEELAPAVPLVAAPAAPARCDFEAELKRAERICRQARTRVIGMFNEIRMGRAIDRAATDELVDGIAQSVGRNPGALISLARLKHRDEYTYMHSVAVCALMNAVGRHLGLDAAQLHEASIAGLVHDIGKIGIPDSVLNKPGKLTDDEFDLVKSHPTLGHRMLADHDSAGAIPLDVVLHHHEKVDGTGYPDGLKDAQIGLYSKMGAVCDVYDAVTSQRPYKSAWNPAEAVRKMAEWAEGHFDMTVFHALVKTVGIYPVGSLVRMESGRLAVVVEHNEANLTAPRVKLFFSIKSQTRIPQVVIDLSDRRTKDRIVSREDPSVWRLSRLDELWKGATSSSAAA
jgi:HD-GYP domain-containing protein (c-di-GMP phosphodiesterase class II)